MRVRRIVSAVLVVLASIAVLASTLAVWGARTVFDTDRFTEVVSDATSDPVVIDAMSTYVTDQAMQLVNADGLIEDILPPALDRLAPIIVGGARSRVEDAVASLLASDIGQQLLSDMVRLAHSAAMRLLEGDGLFGDGITVADGTVTLNTLPLIENVLHALQDAGVISADRDLPELSVDGAPSEQLQELAARFGTTLPPDFGQLTVYESDTLAERGETVARAQQAVVVLKRSIVFLLIATVLLIGLALLLSVRRWRTAAQLGIGIAIAMLLARVVIDRLLDIVPSRVAARIGGSGPSTAAETTRSLLEAVTSGLRSLTALLVIVGLILAVVGFVMGSSGTAVKVRGWFAGAAAAGGAGGRRAGAAIADHADGARLAVGLLGVVVLFIGGLRWWSVIVAVLIVVGGMFAVERARRSVTPAPTG